MTADTIEGCSCPLFCTCYFGASSDEHKCEANNVYKFRKGSHYGDVDLSNAMVWVNLDLGGEWHHNPGPGMPTNWAVVTFDKKTTPAQREAIGKVLNTVFPVKWSKFSTREDSIAWHDDANGSHATMASGLAEISLDKTSTLRPDKKDPVVVKNLQYWFSNVERRVRARVLEAPLRRRRRQPQVLLRQAERVHDRLDREGRRRASEGLEVDRASIAAKRAGDRPLCVSRPPVTIAGEGP